MTDYLTTDTELTSIANAIRTKGGTSASLTYPAGFVDAIDAIPTGGGGTTHVITNIDNPYPNVFDYDTMSFVVTGSPQFEEGMPVIIGTEYTMKVFRVWRSNNDQEVPSTQICRQTSTGHIKVFLMPDCDVYLTMSTR